MKFLLYKIFAMKRSTTVKWDETVSIISNGGSAFFVESALKIKYIVGVLKLFAELVLFGSKEQHDNIKIPAVYKTLCTLFTKFANNSRFDSGFHLIM